MKAYLFPGQGAQYPGMGLDLYEQYPEAQLRFEQANDILGFNITDTMFEGTPDDLKQTKVTQPAIFLHSAIMSEVMGDRFAPEMVAGHSLGEFSALVASGSLSFEDGLQLVSARAQAMQNACEIQESTMAAVIGLDDETVEAICEKTPGIVVPANYNSPGQLVISGEVTAVKAACDALKEAGARRALVLPVGGAFHSPLMQPAREELAAAIEKVEFKVPRCPVYQNVSTTGISDPEALAENIMSQLTSPVKWAQSVRNMISDGAKTFIEVGPGKVLQGLVRKIDQNAEFDVAILANE